MARSVFADTAFRFKALGFSPIARFPDSWPQGWSDYCAELAPDDLLRQWGKAPGAMIALACGYCGLVAIDVDVNQKEILAAVLKALPQARIARFGSKGFALLCRWEGGGEFGDLHAPRFKHIYDRGEGPARRAIVEIKGSGQNITVPPSIHHKTGIPYLWIDPETGEPLEGRPAMAELPEIREEDIERLRAALAPWAAIPRPPREQPRPGVTLASNRRLETYARAGLERAEKDLSGLSENRPTALFREVCALGWAVHHKFLSEHEFADAFIDACRHNGLVGKVGLRAVEASIDSGLSRAANDDPPALEDRPPPKAATKKRRAPPPPPEPEPEPAPGQELVPAAPAPAPLEGEMMQYPTLARDENNKPIRNRSNFALIANYEAWQFAFNQFNAQKVLRGLNGYPQLNGDALGEIRQQLIDAHFIRYTQADVKEIVGVLCHRNPFHPVKDYLDNLDWDGIPRLDEWLHAYFGAANNAANRAIGRKVLIAAVRRIRQPGCQCKYLMVLEGPQDQGKSKAIKNLCPDPELFNESFSIEKHADPKRVIEQNRGKWIAEISELDVRKGDIERVKAMISRTTDADRMAYDIDRTECPRSFIFIGTCNELVLTDTTGNVRFWPVKCEGPVLPEAIGRDRDQLWAEAARAESQGEEHYLVAPGRDAEAQQLIAAAVAEREVGDEFANAIAMWAENYGGTGASLKQIGGEALGLSGRDLNRGTEMRISSALKNRGWKRHKIHGGIMVWRPKTLF